MTTAAIINISNGVASPEFHLTFTYCGTEILWIKEIFLVSICET